jgi:hypothetical protein
LVAYFPPFAKSAKDGAPKDSSFPPFAKNAKDGAPKGSSFPPFAKNAKDGAPKGSSFPPFTKNAKDGAPKEFGKSFGCKQAGRARVWRIGNFPLRGAAFWTRVFGSDRDFKNDSEWRRKWRI